MLSDRFLSLGIVVVYSIIVPGIILLAVDALLDPSLFFKSVTELILIVILLGFSANIVGHITGIIHRKIDQRFSDVPFRLIYLQSYRLPKEVAALLRKDGEFWFCIYMLYWNTAFGLPILLVVNWEEVHTNILFSLYLFIGFLMLIYLSFQVLHSLTNLGREADSLMRKRSTISFGLSHKRLHPLSQQHVGDIASLLAVPIINERIWHSKDKFGFLRVVTKWLHDNRNICIVAVEGSKAIGFARLHPWTHEKRNHVGTIGPIAVHPKYQRKGMGSLLIKELLNVAKNLGITRMEASFPKSYNDIKHLFNHVGFQFECTHKSAFKKVNGEMEDLEQWYILL